MMVFPGESVKATYALEERPTICLFRNDPDVEVVAFKATQIPDIEGLPTDVARLAKVNKPITSVTYELSRPSPASSSR